MRIFNQLERLAGFNFAVFFKFHQNVNGYNPIMRSGFLIGVVSIDTPWQLEGVG